MKRFIPLACAGLLAAAMVTPSFAADIVRPSLKAPVFVAPFSWSGFYVGVNGGYGWGTTKLSNIIGNQSFNDTGGLVGGTVGYNLQTGHWVWGFEGDIDASWLKGTSSAAPMCALGCELKQSWFATARGRVGYAFDRWLPYFTGGLAMGDSKITVTNNASLLGILGGSQTDTRTG